MLMFLDRTAEKLGPMDDLLQATLEHLSEDVYVYEVDTLALRYMNRQARERWGWSKKEVREKYISDTHHSFDLAMFRQHSNPVVTGEKETATIQIHQPSGPAEVVTRMITGLDKKRLFVSTLRDLSERQRLEKARMQTVSMISHELRTPLTSIKGALSLLNSGAVGELPEQAEQVLSIANRNSDRLLNMINDILDYEKLASGKMDFDFETVDLRGLISEAVENMKGYAQVNSVTMAEKLPADPVYARVDSNRLMQVLVNLLSKCCKILP